MHGNLTGAYDVAKRGGAKSGRRHHKTPTGLNRGFGGPQVISRWSG